MQAKLNGYPIKYATSGRGILFNSQNEVLLVSSDGYSWHFPGGMIEHIESSSKACEREVYEETGLQVTVDRFIAISESVIDCRESFGNYLRITDMYYICTTATEPELDQNWQDPDDCLIAHRKFFSEEEYLCNTFIRDMPLGKMKFDEIKSLTGIHLGYFKRD